MENVLCQGGIGFLFAVNGIVDGLDAVEPLSLFDGIDQAEVLQADALREDVEVGDGNLRDGQLVGVLAVL